MAEHRINFMLNLCSFSVSNFLFSSLLVISFSWLNTMCIHLWRAVIATNPIPPRSFYAYALYAMGLPLICQILFYADSIISGEKKFSHRMKEGKLNKSNEKKF